MEKTSSAENAAIIQGQAVWLETVAPPGFQAAAATVLVYIPTSQIRASPALVLY